MIGITYANCGVPLVVAAGGRIPPVGTNPLAIAASGKRKPAFVLDMGVSVAMEKIFQAHERGGKIPAGWAIGSQGHDTNNPAEVLRSGALLPITDPKGFGLGLAHEVLTCILMGSQLFGGGATGFMPYAEPMNVSHRLVRPPRRIQRRNGWQSAIVARTNRSAVRQNEAHWRLRTWRGSICARTR
jgi:LDH2 family malate/lactate/ureidoglycolate dehydrogenase